MYLSLGSLSRGIAWLFYFFSFREVPSGTPLPTWGFREPSGAFVQTRIQIYTGFISEKIETLLRISRNAK